MTQVSNVAPGPPVLCTYLYHFAEISNTFVLNRILNLLSERNNNIELFIYIFNIIDEMTVSNYYVTVMM
jgi:hypothetical protein